MACGTLNPHVVSLSLLAARRLTTKHPWARCELHACLFLEGGGCHQADTRTPNDAKIIPRGYGKKFNRMLI